jgi:hypothetical protein
MRNKTKKIFAQIKIYDEYDHRLMDIEQPIDKAYTEFSDILNTKFGLKKKKQ